MFKYDWRTRTCKHNGIESRITMEPRSSEKRGGFETPHRMDVMPQAMQDRGLDKLPKSRADWSSWVIAVTRSTGHEAQATFVTWA